MTEPPDALLPPRLFVAARGRLAQAHAARDRMNKAWNAGTRIGHGTFEAWVESRDDGTRELWSTFELPGEHGNALENAAREFVTHLRAALDECVLATANATSRWGMAEPDTHRMPLCRDPDEFDNLPHNGALQLLRPDQIRAIRQLQPFVTGTRGRDFIGRHMTHFLNLVEAHEQGAAISGVWADRGTPEFHTPDSVTITDLTVDDPGIATPRKRVATYRVDPTVRADEVSVNPMTSFDAILNADPKPENSDDNASARTQVMLLLTRRLIEGLERSTASSSLLERFGPLDELMPIETNDEWVPIHFDDFAEEQQVRDMVSASEIGRATYRAPGGYLIFLKADETGRIVGREIPDAAPPPSTEDTHGIAIEHATRAVGARWGLPDFVLEPAVVKKGSGIREYPDGTILSGHQGIALQVKARETNGDTVQRATNWLTKKAKDGLSQARGTIRTTLGKSDVTLKNLRGRVITFNGQTIDWLPVVILDHPDPPPDVSIEPDGKGPHVVLLRRDWEFLWYQLRSAAAIVGYLHRVADEGSVELGTETYRYFDLAHKDANAASNPLPEWLHGTEAQPADGPLLPADPAPASDEAGHAVFHTILEDIASSPFDGGEADRVHILALIDRFAVTNRAELGRTLLRRLDYCAAARPGEMRAQHKIAYVDDSRIQLIFTVMGQLTVTDQDYFRVYALHRRQVFLRSSGAQGPVLPWTVAVALTPRRDGRRPWDTTVIATNGPEIYDDQEFEDIGRAFVSQGGRDQVIT